MELKYKFDVKHLFIYQIKWPHEFFIFFLNRGIEVPALMARPQELAGIYSFTFLWGTISDTV